MHTAADIGIIFDMDGVLIDSPTHIETTFDEIFRRHGTSLAAFAEVHPAGLHGLSADSILTVLREGLGVTIAPEYIHTHSNEIFYKILKENNVGADAHLINFLSALQQEQIPAAVGSASPNWRVKEVLEYLGLEDRFSAIVGDEVKKHKPHPDVFLAAAEKLQRKPEYCIVIEDAEPGIQAAKAAGMKAIGYTQFSKHADKLTGADKLINSFRELTIPDLVALLETRG